MYEWNTRTYYRGVALADGIPESPVILEAGTGVYNPASAPFLMVGAARLILLEPYVSDNIDPGKLSDRLEGFLRLAESDDSFPMARSRCENPMDRVEISRRLWEDTGIPDNSVDVIFSHSVLEHVRLPHAVLAESYRILRPAGWLISGIDLRDHFFRYPWEMLKYSTRQWNALTTRSGGSGYMNRWRAGDWERELETNGFLVRMQRRESFDAAILDERPLLDPQFQHLPDDELMTSKIVIAAQKPAVDSEG